MEDILFDMRDTEVGKKYIKKAKQDMILEWIFFVFAIIIIIGSIPMWVNIEQPPLKDLIIVLITLAFVIPFLFWFLVIFSRKVYEAKVTLPLIDNDGIFEINQKEEEINRYSYNNIITIYTNPNEQLILIILKKPTDEGIRFVHLNKNSIIDVDKFMDVLKRMAVDIRNEAVTKETFEKYPSH